jgi:ketosteroid isomerase-like protein
MKADDITEKEVTDVIRRFAENFTKRDLNGIISLIAPDEDTVLYATEADEKRIGLDEIIFQIERNWSLTEAISCDYNWISISAAGVVAWAAIDMVFRSKVKGHNVIILPSRVTMVFEKRSDKWLIVQGHFSYPDEKVNLWDF